MDKTVQVNCLLQCPDCRFSTIDGSEFDEHYYLVHITWHDTCIVKSEGKELFRIVSY